MADLVFFFQVTVIIGLIIGFGPLALGLYLELTSKRRIRHPVR